MFSPKTSFRKVANDAKPAPPKRGGLASIVIALPTHAPLPALAAVALGLFLVGAGFGYLAFWLGSRPTDTPTPPPAKTELKAEFFPAEPAYNKNTAQPKAADILLPADSLAAPDTPQATSDNQNDINIVADKMSDLPFHKPATDSHVVDLSPSEAPSADQLLRDASQMIAANDPHSALTVYNQILAQDADNHAALSGQAFVLAQLGEYRSAVKTGHRILQLYPDDAGAATTLIAALGASPDNSAITELLGMEARDNDNASIHAALAQHYTRLDNYPEALRHLDQATRLQPDNMTYRLDLAILYDRAEYRDQALALYRQIINQLAASDTAPPLTMPLQTIRQRIAYLQGE